MTIASQTSRISYNGDASTVAFAVPFYFLANADLVVLLMDASGNIATQTMGTNYSVSGAGVSGGGTVTMTVAPPSGFTLVIYRDPSQTQTASFNNNDPFPAKSMETALDRLTMLVQRLSSRLGRAPLLKETSTYSGLVLPDPSPGLALQWRADSLGLENATMSIPVGSFALASQSQAEVGTNNTTLMTPLRSLQSDAANAWNTPPTLPTRTALAAATIHPNVQYVLCAAATANGDGHPEIFGRIATPSPVKSYHVQSADGSWWVPTGRVMNLKAWGCKIDGTTDDTTALKDAIAYQISTQRVLFHPGGVLKITSKVQPGDGWTMFGTGITGSTIRAAGMTTPLFQGANGALGRNYNWVLRDFAIDNTNRNAAGAIGLDLRNVTDARVDNVWITNVETGLQVYGDATVGGAFYNEFSKVLISTVKTGMFVGGIGNENKFFGCRVVDVTGSGGTQGTGIVCSDGSHNVFVAPAIETFSGIGINVSGTGADHQFFSPRLENTPTVGTGIQIASTQSRVSIFSPQYIGLSTNLTNNSNSTRVNGLRRYVASGLAVGSVSANTSKDVLVTIGAEVGTSDNCTVIVPSTLNSGIVATTIPTSSGVYVRFSNVTTGSISVGTISVTILINEVSG